jgi:hypothetical protein
VPEKEVGRGETLALFREGIGNFWHVGRCDLASLGVCKSKGDGVITLNFLDVVRFLIYLPRGHVCELLSRSFDGSCYRAKYKAILDSSCTFSSGSVF